MYFSLQLPGKLRKVRKEVHRFLPTRFGRENKPETNWLHLFILSNYNCCTLGEIPELVHAVEM